MTRVAASGSFKLVHVTPLLSDLYAHPFPPSGPLLPLDLRPTEEERVAAGGRGGRVRTEGQGPGAAEEEIGKQ